MIMRDRRRETGVWIILAFSMMVASGAFAAETDELRIGMDNQAVIGVFTMNQSCRNTILEEEPDRLAWNAILDGHDARVEVAFSGGRAVALVYRYSYRLPDEGAALFRRLADQNTGQYGAPSYSLDDPAQRTDRWSGGIGAALIELTMSSAQREIVMTVSGRH